MTHFDVHASAYDSWFFNNKGDYVAICAKK